MRLYQVKEMIFLDIQNYKDTFMMRVLLCQEAYFCDKNNRSGVGFDKPQIEGKHGSTFGGVSPESFGHYGYTGSMAWADPDKNIIFIFLSNRTYPTRENTLLQTSNTRTRSQEIVYKSLIDSE